MVLFFPKLLVFVAALLPATAVAQAALAAPQLSPQSAYDQVVSPLEITRRSVENWSNAETAALALAIQQAREQCAARAAEQFSGDPLLAFARLCSLGQQWPVVGAAATRYIVSEDPKPQLAQAYAFQVDAALHTNDPKVILTDSLAMLHAVPYDSLVHETSGDALHYLQLAFTPDALTLYAAREPLILDALRACGPISSDPLSSAPASGTAVRLHTLYADGVTYAALQQFGGDSTAAHKTITELDAALPSPLQSDDAIPIDQTRRQYALLGTRLPRLPLTLSLYSVGETPRINTDYGSSTVLLLFPDWCAQCVRMAQQILPTLFRISENDIHLYALLAQPAPSVPAPPRSSGKPKSAGKAGAATQNPIPDPIQKTAADLLHGTPTLIVPPETLIQFAATDFPLLIATDPKGIIRFIQPAPENALNAGDLLDQVTAHIARQWPRETPAMASTGHVDRP